MRMMPSTKLFSSGTAPPERPLPMARGVIATNSRVAKRCTAETSWGEPGKTTANGRLSYHVPS